MNTERTAEPTVFVLFGATGDLARRMVIPAFFKLAIEDLLPDDWRLVGNGRGDVAHEDFRDRVRRSLEEFGPKPEEGPWDEFSSRLLFAGGGFEQNDPGSLLDVLHNAENEVGGNAQRIHYFAVPPVAFGPLTQALQEHNLTERARVVYEKPYGTSPESFRQLDEIVHSVLDESQVYRIDHFLGKEAAQDLHTVRFANGLFHGVWNCDVIESVQIDIPETLDVADRISFYDQTGAALDMLVTHLFQIAAGVAMEPPASFGADDLQTARETVISNFRPLDPHEVVLGQFDGYKNINGVAPGSTTDTFVAAKMWVDTDRWRGVPFLMRTGKRMAVSQQRVSLTFRKPSTPQLDLPHHGNVLSFSLSGDGAIDLSMVVEEPGADANLVATNAALPLNKVAGADPLPPYSRLIHDVLVGDRTLFTRPDGLEYAWNVITPMLDARPEPQSYAPGSWGPQAALELPGPHGWLLQ